MIENLIMIMNRSLIPIEFSIAYILTVNLDSFVKVGSEFYSYGIKLIVLRNIRIHVFLSYLRCRIRHIMYFNLCKKIENNKVDRMLIEEKIVASQILTFAMRVEETRECWKR